MKHITLYTGTLGASETKTYHLKLWLDYDATVEQAANKVYQSKINVIANPEIEVVDNLEATFELNDTTLTSNLTTNVTSATYCTTTDNLCTPSTSATIANNTYTVELQGNENKQMVCTRLNGTSKIICSNSLAISPKLLNEEVLANATTQSTRTDFSTVVTNTTTGTIYQAEDDDGTTYYFAGAPTDNWVRWAGFYWRIIRINGDGTIRLIYNGTSTTTTGTGTQISTSSFNSSYRDNAYVGFKYTTNNAHGTGTNSTILGVLNTWYQNNLASYADDIDMNAGFCNDRTPYSGSGTGTTATDYAEYNRLVINKSPSFKCTNSSDLFTISSSNQGNKSLTYPIGLITADEVAYAGGVVSSTNSSYYLYTNQYYWTMSPFRFTSSGYAFVSYVHSVGALDSDYVDFTTGVRPVVNLKVDVQISTGSGTADNPYIVQN